MSATKLDIWVAENNPAPELQYGKGFWDYVEMVRRLVEKFEAEDERVLGTYVVHTPPPTEELLMPAVGFVIGDNSLALKFDFGSDAKWPFEWTVSVKRASPYRGPIFGLFDGGDSPSSQITGFGEEWSLPSYFENQTEFTCLLEDEWDVATLLRLVSYEQ